MKRARALVALLAAALVAHGGMDLAPAYACTLPANFDAVASSDLIVEGRVFRWDEVAESQIEYQIEVERAFKGPATAGGTLMVTDFGSRLHGDWESSGGLCGTFSGDPDGKYIVIGLRGEAGGELRSTNQTRFFLGDGPEGPAYEAAIRQVSDGSTTGPPATGSGGDGASSDDALWLVVLASAAVLAAAVAAVFIVRRRATNAD